MPPPIPRIPVCRTCGNMKRTVIWRRKPLPTRVETYPRRQRHYVPSGGRPLCGRDVDGVTWEAA